MKTRVLYRNVLLQIKDITFSAQAVGIVMAEGKEFMEFKWTASVDGT